MAYYRNDTTGRVQFHPKSGIGASLGSTEIAEDGKPVKPRTSLAPSSDELRAAKALLKDNSGASRIERNAAQVVIDAGAAVANNTRAAKAASKTASKTPAANPGGGSTKQEGDQ